MMQRARTLDAICASCFSESDCSKTPAAANRRPGETIESDIDDCFCDMLFVEGSFGAIPARQPSDHSEKAERRDGEVDVAQFAVVLQCLQRRAEIVEVFA